MTEKHPAFKNQKTNLRINLPMQQKTIAIKNQTRHMEFMHEESQLLFRGNNYSAIFSANVKTSELKKR
ncbi:MAG TPA: hypothetical protein PK372_04465 [Rugosibacter sp.]|nr:hypothetical protein [Rugosibacter sp.]HQQ35173.1 hypothetical protein [Rugosibacter sp.]